jgi:hypothetical protein
MPPRKLNKNIDARNLTIDYSKYDLAAMSLFDRVQKPPSPDRCTLYNDLLISLRHADILHRIDALYLMAAGDKQLAGLNIIGSEFTLEAIGKPLFHKNRSMSGDGSASYFNTNLNPASSPNIKLSKDSSHIMFYCRTPRPLGTIVQGQIMGAVDTKTYKGVVQMNPLDDKASKPMRLFNNSKYPRVAAQRQGCWIADRTNLASFSVYRNGELIHFDDVETDGLVDLPIWIGGINVDNSRLVSPCSDEIAAVSIGASLGPVKQLQLYAAIQAFLSGVEASN